MLVLNRAMTGRLSCVLAMLVSAAVSIVFFLETRNGPLQRWTEWNQTDGHYYDIWARNILAGDLLCRNMPVPVIPWQLQVAESWMKKDPALAAEMALEATKHPGRTPASLLWERALGVHRFYQEPGYQYGVALIYALFGPHVQAVFIIQLLLGVLTVGLVFAVSERYFDHYTATLGRGRGVVDPHSTFEIALVRRFC